MLFGLIVLLVLSAFSGQIPFVPAPRGAIKDDTSKILVAWQQKFLVILSIQHVDKKGLARVTAKGIAFFVRRLHQIKAQKGLFRGLSCFLAGCSAGYIGTNRAFAWNGKDANCKQAI